MPIVKFLKVHVPPLEGQRLRYILRRVEHGESYDTFEKSEIEVTVYNDGSLSIIDYECDCLSRLPAEQVAQLLEIINESNEIAAAQRGTV